MEGILFTQESNLCGEYTEPDDAGTVAYYLSTDHAGASHMAPASGTTGAETPTLVESIAVEGGVELLENGEGGWYDEDGTRWFYYDVQPELPATP